MNVKDARETLMRLVVRVQPKLVAGVQYARRVSRAALHCGGEVVRGALILAIPLTAAATAVAGIVWLLNDDSPWKSFEQCLRWMKVLDQSAQLGPTLRERLTYGVAAFGGATVLAAVREVADVFPVTWKVIAGRGTIEEMLRPAAALFATTAGALLAVIAALKAPQDTSQLQSPILISLQTASHNEMPMINVVPSAGSDRIRFVFTFDKEATRRSLRGADANDHAVTLAGRDTDFIRTLIGDLAACSLINPVQITVAGFASSSEWTGERPRVSRNKNLALAMLRANNVVTEIGKAAKAAGVAERVSAAPKKWLNVDEMERERWFNDRPPTGQGGVEYGIHRLSGAASPMDAHGQGMPLFSKKAARLTRRVELRLNWAAECEGRDQRVALR